MLIRTLILVALLWPASTLAEGEAHEANSSGARQATKLTPGRAAKGEGAKKAAELKKGKPTKKAKKAKGSAKSKGKEKAAPKAKGKAAAKAKGKAAAGAPAAAKKGAEPDDEPADDKPAGEKAAAKKKPAPTGRPDLAAVPERASRTFRKTTEENRKKGDKVLDAVLRALKTATNWAVDPANRRQVSAAVARIAKQRKKLEEAKKLYQKAAKHARLVHTLAIKAARIRGLVNDEDANIKRHLDALEELKKDPKQQRDMSRVRAVDLLAQALADFIRGRLAPAIILVDRSIKTYDAIALAHVFKGSLHYLTQDRIRAMHAWKEALRLDPKNIEIRRALEQMGAVIPTAPKEKKKKRSVKKRRAKPKARASSRKKRREQKK